MEAMERLIHGRTTFMIAHRPGTLANCDALLQVEQGHLIEITQAASIAVVKERLARDERDAPC